MMLKAYGYGLLILGVLMGLFTPFLLGSPAFAILYVVAMGLGCVLVMTPAFLNDDRKKQSFDQFVDAIKIKNFKNLATELEELALVSRRDGLLALESIRRSAQDPLIQGMVKQLMDGVEVKQIILSLDHRYEYTHQQLSSVKRLIEQACQIFPLVGLTGSLLLMRQSPVQVESMILPLLAGVGIQILIQIFYSPKIVFLCEQTKLYFDFLKEGMMAVSEGLNSELLMDSLMNRLGETIKRVEK